MAGRDVAKTRNEPDGDDNPSLEQRIARLERNVFGEDGRNGLVSSVFGKDGLVDRMRGMETLVARGIGFWGGLALFGAIAVMLAGLAIQLWGE